MGSNTLRWLRRGATVLSIAALVLTVAVPAQAAGGGPSAPRSPCLGVGFLPPYAHVDPNCVNPFAMADTGTPVDARAVASQLDAHITWDHAGSDANVWGFVVYKGATPYTMEHVALVRAHESWSYEDEDALTDAGAVWYVVRALYATGGHADSVPVLLEYEAET